MTEWAILAAIAAATAVFVAWPRPGDVQPDAGEAVDDLHARRAAILAELRELDDDLATGRITEADRTDARRALGPRLREVTEALRALGEDAR